MNLAQAMGKKGIEKWTDSCRIYAGSDEDGRCARLGGRRVGRFSRPLQEFTESRDGVRRLWALTTVRNAVRTIWK